MKSPLIFAAAISISTLAYSQSTPDLKGTWAGTSNTTVIGAGQHHPGNEPMKTVRFRNVELQFIIDQQKGPNFSGKLVSATYEEVLAGVLSHDGKSGVMADEDGTFSFKLVGKNKMEICYTHAKSSSIVAACTLTERK